MRDRGVFLIDVKLDPVDGSSLAEQVPGLIHPDPSPEPEKIIVIKASVYDAAYAALREAGLPVVAERVAFPGSGQQRRFDQTFYKALRSRPPRRRRD